VAPVAIVKPQPYDWTEIHDLGADEAHYLHLAAVVSARTADLRAELTRRRIARLAQHGAVLGQDGTFAECQARNQAILRGAR
jgi:hypothetical protein